MSSGSATEIPLFLTSVSHPSDARVTDYLCGGEQNWSIDRRFAEHATKLFPPLRNTAGASRWFMRWAIEFLMELGVRQFLDIGCGSVTMPDALHMLAEKIAIRRGCQQRAAVVYVDHDPIAVAHTEIQLDVNGDPDRHVVVLADLRDPHTLWRKAVSTGCLNPAKPVAALLGGVLQFSQPDTAGNDLTMRAVAKLRDLLVPGSCLVITHLTADGLSPTARQQLDDVADLYDRECRARLVPRSREDIELLFGDFEVAGPGLVNPDWWASALAADATPPLVSLTSPHCPVWAGICHKPQKSPRDVG